MWMFLFSRLILLMGMRIRHMMRNTNAIKEDIQLMIFATLISMHGQQLAIKEALNMCLKVSKNFKDIIFVFKQIDPHKFAKIIINNT
jgi:hypothetical protein